MSTGDQDKHLQKPVERENIYVAVRNMKDCDIKPPEKIDQTTVAHYMDPPLPSLPVSEPQGEACAHRIIENAIYQWYQ